MNANTENPGGEMEREKDGAVPKIPDVYKDYQDAIRNYYRIMKGKPEFPQRLLNPERRKLRDECLSVYRLRPEKKDIPMLKVFFDVQNDSDILKSIKNVDLDRFRPLVNFMRGKTGSTDDKNLLLLGWLLDFGPRPYNKDFDYTGYVQSLDTEEMEGKKTVRERHRPSKEMRHQVSLFGNTKMKLLSVGVVILIGTTWCLAYYNGHNQPAGVGGDLSCMVWSDDRYLAVNCDSPAVIGLLLPMDHNRLKHFRRTTRPDTITSRDIGKLWYRKRTLDSLDYFTMGGTDPVDPKMTLRPLSKHIFDTHLKNNNLVTNSAITNK